MLRGLIPLLLAALFLGGCAAIEQSDARRTERYLAAAGFQMRPANTPQRQASLAALTPYHMQMRMKGSQVVYLYADPSQGCLYVGGPSEYSAYEKMVLQRDIAEQQQMAAAQMQMSEMDWDYWGPWSFGGVPGPVRVR